MEPRRKNRILALMLLWPLGCASGAAEEPLDPGAPDGGPGRATGVAARLRATAESPAPEEPEATTGCMQGGAEGTMLVYSEPLPPASRQRSVAYDYDADLASELGLPAAPEALPIDPAALFGEDVNAIIRSDRNFERFDLSGFVPPSKYGTFYRRAVKSDRVAELWASLESGDEVKVGTIALADWWFEGGLGIWSECPVRPPTEWTGPE